jgi:Fe-S cluster assembly protein SufD
VTQPAGPTARPRPARRSPSDLPFRFADRGLAQALAAERGEPDWLREERLAAWEAFEAMPVEGNLLYTPYIDLRGASLDDARPYIRTASEAGPVPRRVRGVNLGARAGQPAPTGTADTEAPDTEAPDTEAPDTEATGDVAGIIDLSEDGLLALELSPRAKAAGVVLETFGAALARDPDGLRGDLEGGGTLPANDKLAMLARGFWSQGVRLIVPAGAVIERPFLVRWQSSVPERALITRTLVRLGDGASATLVEEQVPSGPPIACAEGETVPQGFYQGTTEVVLGRDASLSMASIQDLGPNQVAFQHRHAVIGEAANLHWALAQLGGRLVRSRVDNRLEGDRSSVEQVEIVFGTEEQLFDLTSYTRHLGRDTTGNLLSKGALLDRSRSYMKGLITIEKSAVGTDSFLGEFGMNLSRAARAVAIPSLEIDQPDCRRAAHSSSVGPIDPGQLFYLETRGIPPDEARKFIVLGFLEPVVARVPLDSARDHLRELLEGKWAAGLAATSGAAA